MRRGHVPPACGQVAEERQPAGAVLGRRDLQPEDLPVSLGIHPGREQRVHVDRAPALTHFQHQRVGREERIRAGIERAGAERLDLLVEVLGHHTDLRLGQPGDAQGLDQLLHPPRRHPEQIGRGHHRDQRGLGPRRRSSSTVREVAALPQLRDRQLDRAGAVSHSRRR
jgi:hypothetical protein